MTRIGSCLLTLVALAAFVEGQSSDDKKPKECPEFKCPARAGTFSDPCNCRRFYTCNNNFAYKNVCPSSLYFDGLKKQCLYKNEAVCGPVDAPPPKKEVDDAERASKCDEDTCVLPYCFCSKRGEKPPVPLENAPQFILISIDGAVNNNNYEYYSKLLNNDGVESEEKKLKATFFVNAEYCDYYNVEQLYVAGHEIGLSSVSGSDLQNANVSHWRNELGSLRRILKKYSGVPEEEILGMRAPGIRPGNNEHYEAMIAEGLVYDSSVSTVPLDVNVWPYTLDHRIPHQCRIKSCPTKSFPGVWEIPLNSHFVDGDGGGKCPFLDQCIFSFQTPDDVFEWLKEDFNRSYLKNKAPYALSVHTNWFLQEHQLKGLEKFIAWTKEKDDIFYLTMTELLLWLTDENIDKSTSTNYRTPPMFREREMSCANPNSCEMSHVENNGIEALRYMKTCEDCPYTYPWFKRWSPED